MGNTHPQIDGEVWGGEESPHLAHEASGLTPTMWESSFNHCHASQTILLLRLLEHYLILPPHWLLTAGEREREIWEIHLNILRKDGRERGK